jgi:AcrR family transcriptional regulator
MVDRQSFGAPGRGPDPRAVRTRAAALSAARDLLVEQGWAGVTHVTVAERSGIGRTTLYRHWPDTTALVRDALAHHIAVAHTEPTGDLRADLLHELEASRAMLHEPSSDRAVRVIVERAAVDPAFAEMKDALYRAGTGTFRAIVESGKERGELPAGLATDFAVDQLVGPLFFRRLLVNQPVPDGYVSEVVDGFLRAHRIHETREVPNP